MDALVVGILGGVGGAGLGATVAYLVTDGKCKAAIHAVQEAYVGAERRNMMLREEAATERARRVKVEEELAALRDTKEGAGKADGTAS